MSPVLLIGNNLAMLVGARELLRQGRGVTLLTDAKPLGAHFAGLRLQGQSFDIGMVMLEQVRSTPPSHDLRTYRAELRNDWTRFGHLSAAWMEQQVPLVRVPTPRCRLQGRTGPDYLIANRLDMLANLSQGGLPVPGPDGLASDDPRHPRHKTDSAAYEQWSYAEAAALCHGEPFHALAVEPFVRKLLGQGSETFLARYHRAGWVPLFYPETLRAALLGQPTGLPEYPFWVPDTGCVADLASKVRDEVFAHPLLRLVEEPLESLCAPAANGGGLQATMKDGSVFSAEQVALGVGTERCLSLLAPSSRPPSTSTTPTQALPAASVMVGFCQVPARAITQPVGCLMVVDEDHASYRLTDQDHLAGRDAVEHRITIEAGPERLAAAHPGLAPEAALALEMASLLGISQPEQVNVIKCITARQALVLPTQLAVQAGKQAHACLSETLPGALLTGTLLGYGVASFNDQVVQGLQLAQEFA